jgi:hypothetical protein
MYLKVTTLTKADGFIISKEVGQYRTPDMIIIELMKKYRAYDWAWVNGHRRKSLTVENICKAVDSGKVATFCWQSEYTGELTSVSIIFQHNALSEE